nr:ribonuclease H-like domain, reverse transcriptase, RNA-dependent DNA polymerase [Tanacetum cinerariifolium]
GLGFKEYFGSDEVFDLSTPIIFDPEPVNREVKSLYERFVKAGDTHEVQPSITGTFMPTSFNSVLEETRVTFGSKSPTSINTSDSNDFVSCDNSDNIGSSGSRNSSASTSAGRSILAASGNRSASIHAGRSIPAASRNQPTSIHAGRHILAGRDDGVLLLSPQQVVLGEITDLTCNGVPRTMVDLINLHGFTLNDPQGRLKSVMTWASHV